MIVQSLQELEGELRLHPDRQVYLVLGAEEYLCRQALDLIRRKVLSHETLAFNYSEFDAQTDSVAEISEAINTFPMMAPKRLVLVKNLEQLAQDEKEKLVRLLETLSKRSVLVLAASELDRRKTFYRQLAERAYVAEFVKLKEYALQNWANDYVRKQGIRMTPYALKRIMDLAGSDLQTLINEIEKLILYAGKDKTIPDPIVDALISNSRQHHIFELTNAIGQRDRKAALYHIANLLQSDEPPLYLAAMIARHFRQVLIAKELLQEGRNRQELADEFRVPPNVLDLLLRQAHSLDLGAVRLLYMRLAEIDRRIKSSGVDPGLMLETFICSL